jgi:hypothetical protein
VTGDEITSALEPGRELDALVDEFVMLATLHAGNRNYRQGGEVVPHYSTQIFAMWLVVEQLRKEGWNATLRYNWQGYSAQFDKILCPTVHAFVERRADWSPEDGALPLAVCRAAMLIVDGRAAKVAS